MCGITNHDDEEQEDINDVLIRLLSLWKLSLSVHLTDEEIATIDWIEECCSLTKDRLVKLKDEGRLDDALRL